jgi:DNA-binding response OmpR family regulator
MEELRNHVLVIDIDDDFLIGIERLLEDQGFDTTITWDVNEALDLLASKQFEVVLVGHHPPELHASEILRHMQGARKAPSCLVVQSSGLVSPDSRFFLSQGARGVLCKWHHGDIAERIKKCLAQWQEAIAEGTFGRRAG